MFKTPSQLDFVYLPPCEPHTSGPRSPLEGHIGQNMVSHSLRLCRLAAHPWHASRITRCRGTLVHAGSSGSPCLTVGGSIWQFPQHGGYEHRTSY